MRVKLLRPQTLETAWPATGRLPPTENNFVGHSTVCWQDNPVTAASECPSEAQTISCNLSLVLNEVYF